MNATARNSATIFSGAWKVFGLAAIILFLALPGFSQNTKGDRPEVSGSSGRRESRFKSPFKKKGKNKQPTYNRAQSKGASRASSARKPPKAGKASQKIYPQRGKFVNNASKTNDKQRASRRTASGSRVHVRSNTGKTRNVYPQYGRYTNNPSRKSKESPKPVSNKSTLARLQKLQGPEPSGPGKKKKVVPRSASRSFTARKSINVYANFPRPKHKGEQAYTKDISGHKLRRKNYETPKINFTNPTAHPYSRKKRVGDRPYTGPSGSYRSATRTTPRAWRGDISGHRIRGRNYSSKSRVEGQPILPSRKNKARYGDRAYRGAMPTGGYRSASKPGEKRTGKSPLPAKVPGIGADRIGGFQGNIKGYRREKGGGSRSGKTWNNKGTPVPVRIPKDGGRAATFQGNVKYNRGFNDQGEEFTGYKKGQRRPLKGAGSVSGKVWNNKGTPVPVRVPKDGGRPATFQGNVKYNRGFNDQGEEFTGYLKGRKRPLKAAGTASGRVWNNKQAPIPVRPPSDAGRAVGSFPGRIKRYEQSPGFNDQGEEFTGYVKRHWFWKDYVKNENSADKALKKKRATSATYQTGELQIQVRQRDYVRNKNSSEDALLKQKPTKNTQRAGELQIKVKQRDYVQNKNSSEDALLKQKPTKSTYRVGGLQVKVREREHGKKPGSPEDALPTLKPSKETIKASQYARGARRTWDYVHNPNSADEALKVREPGKAFARSTDYQGNIKMQKFKFFEKNRQLHPDAQFVKTNKNNVDSERDILTNFKLWWARLFKKEETQPDHLKDKGHKPRYDKGEEGLWYD